MSNQQSGKRVSWIGCLFGVGILVAAHLLAVRLKEAAYEKSKGTWTTYTGDNSALKYEPIRILAADDQGRVWVGTEWGSYVIDSNGTWNTLSNNMHAENGSFQAPKPFSPTGPREWLFWYGTEGLWTALHADGVWSGWPDNPEGFTQKIMWWSDSYVLKNELEPAMVMSGRRSDAKSEPLKFYGATNAMADDIGKPC